MSRDRDIYADLDTLIGLCHNIVSLLAHTLNRLDNQERETMATQTQVRQDIATLHTTLTSGVASIQAFQKAEGDRIGQLQDQLKALTDAAASADIPDDIEQSIKDANDLAASISTQLLDPNQPHVQPAVPPIEPSQPLVPPTTGLAGNPPAATTGPDQPPPATPTTPVPGPTDTAPTGPTGPASPGAPGTVPATGPTA